MNPLLYEDLFFTICDYFTFKEIVQYEILSKHHHKMIRQHHWYHPLKIKKIKLLIILIHRYPLKNLDLSYSGVSDETVKLLNCHTLNLRSTRVTDESVKNLKCHTLNLRSTYVTDESVKHLKCHTLNLAVTKVTDESVKHLKCHTLNLQWTRITNETIALLKTQGCHVTK